MSDRPAGFEPVLGRRMFPLIYPLAGLVFLAMAVFGGPGDHRLVFVSFGLAAVSMFSTPERPAMAVVAGRAVLRYRPWRSPVGRFSFLLIVAGATILWYGLTADVPRWFVAAGLILMLGSGFFTALLLTGISRHITFAEHTLHVAYAGFDWELPWEAITAVATRAKQVERGGSYLQIVLTCPPSAVIDRSKPTARARQRDPEGQWTIPTGAWTVEPGALAATIRFLVDHPDQRASITPKQVRAMLTPPRGSERARIAQQRRLDEYLASTDPTPHKNG
ncbi:hypothetical protein VMT65_31700 [Nocardia sp. CDC153]|uniref:hypothetical protein n=1 Tax=Nocardia sp. CDC153 TaxID=3112167 RepID=UPI002DBEA2C9|nr:hypothetical protein [Nocardia sp. CDC153]MEC3957636.1 hypothetical protein [Nocardia sp. CDC153]